MRTLTIGDIHGCLRALDLLLKMIRLQPDDLLITLGDHIDRGPHSRVVLDHLIELKSTCRLVALKGNHEVMMLDARDDELAFSDWYACGGRQTLESYRAPAHWQMFAGAIPAPHWRFLEETCQPFYEMDTHFFVHANVLPDLPLNEQPEFMLYWEPLHSEQSRPHASGKIMICGHSAQRSGLPLDLDHAVCIDTWAYGDGWLTCLDVNSGEYWQANQQCETRSGRLDI